MPCSNGIAIVVPTLNEANGIAAVIAALLRDLPAKVDTRLFVADGGSSDGTVAIVAEMARTDPRIILIDNPKRLQAVATNLVAETVADWAAYLVRCDAHAEYAAGFVRRVVESIDRSGADAVVVPMDSVGRTCTGRAIAWVSDTIVGSGGSAHRGGATSGFVDHGHHAGWRLASFRRIGGYDESFAQNEDAEFDCRLRRSGGSIWLDAGIRLRYHVRPTLRALGRQYHGYGRGRSRTVRRHPGSMRMRQFAVPAFVVANLIALGAAAWFPALLALPALYLLLLSAVSVQVALRHRSICGLRAGPAALVMHVAWAAGFIAGLALIRERRWIPVDAALQLQLIGAGSDLC